LQCQRAGRYYDFYAPILRAALARFVASGWVIRSQTDAGNIGIGETVLDEFLRDRFGASLRQIQVELAWSNIIAVTFNHQTPNFDAEQLGCERV
jgi:hypothetical protein